MALRNTTVWAALVVITLVSWWASADGGLSTGAAALAVGLAFLKVGLVGWEFMELRHAPGWLVGIFGTWVVVVGALLVGLSLA